MVSDLRHLGLLTVGQSPRADVTPTLRAILGESVHLCESGALDGLSEADIAALAPEVGETPLETRSSAGPVILSQERLLPLLEAAAERLADSCEVALLLCSGEFPTLTERVPQVIQPVHLLRGVVQGWCSGRTLGIVGPETDMEEAPQHWGVYARELKVSAASPYGPPEGISSAAVDVVDRGAEFVFLNDMAFTTVHQVMAKRAGRPVLCATTAIASLLKDVM